MLPWLLATLLTADAATRAKDVGAFHGVRDNPLTGAGLVVGLHRTGDSLRNEAAIRTLANRLQGLGASLSVDDISTRNVALVMVTATLGPAARTGSKLDVTVAASGDASSLEGGVLLMTPLLAPDGNVYAVAEGPLVVGGFEATAGGSGVRKNTPTVGIVPGGALVEREVATTPDFDAMETVEFVLRSPDFTTATRLADAIDRTFGAPIAEPVSGSTVEIAVPPEHRGQFARFAAQVEAVEVDVDRPARVVVSERTGTVVMGAEVRVAPVAVAHGGLTIEVRRLNDVSQPPPFSIGETRRVSNTIVDAQEARGQLVMVEGVAIGELVAALNDLGVKPRDLIVILQAIRSAGALDAEVVPL